MLLLKLFLFQKNNAALGNGSEPDDEDYCPECCGDCFSIFRGRILQPYRRMYARPARMARLSCCHCCKDDVDEMHSMADAEYHSYPRRF